jgi:hypothetical protein
LIDAPIQSLLPPPFDLLALLISQDNQLHGVCLGYPLHPTRCLAQRGLLYTPALLQRVSG